MTLAGDQDAYGELVLRWQGAALSQANSVLRSVYLSEDAKETVMKVISDFEEEVEKARKWKYIKVPCQDSFICIIPENIAEKADIGRITMRSGNGR